MNISRIGGFVVLLVLAAGAAFGQTPGEIGVTRVIQLSHDRDRSVGDVFFPASAKIGDSFDVQIVVADPSIAEIAPGGQFRVQRVHFERRTLGPDELDRSLGVQFNVAAIQCGETTFTATMTDANGMTFRGTGMIRVGVRLSERIVTLLPRQSASIKVTDFSNTPRLFSKIVGRCTPYDAVPLGEIFEVTNTDEFTVIAGQEPGNAICRVAVTDRSGGKSFTYEKSFELVVLSPTPVVEFPAVGVYLGEDWSVRVDSGPPGALEYQAVETDPIFFSIESGSGSNDWYLNLQGMPERVPCSRNQYMLNCTSDYVDAVITGPPGPTRGDITVRGHADMALSQETAGGSFQLVGDEGGDLNPGTSRMFVGPRPKFLDVFFRNPAGTRVRSDLTIIVTPTVVPGTGLSRAEQSGGLELVSELSLSKADMVRVRIPENDGPHARDIVIESDSGDVTITQEGMDSRNPRIAAGGVVEGAAFRPGIVSGGWATILGEFFIEGTRSWGDGDFVATPSSAKGRVGQGTLLLPTELDGVSVTVGGSPAFVQFISPNQINVLIDEDGMTGPVDVVVTTPLGQSLGTIATKTALRPQLFRFSPNGRIYAAGVHLDGTFLGPANLFGGAVATRPARPGDIVQLFGTGWGQTNPPTTVSQVVTGATPLASPVTVQLGGVDAVVQFAGLVGSGLYQINLVIPDLPPGDYIFDGEIDGVGLDVPVLISVEQ